MPDKPARYRPPRRTPPDARPSPSKRGYGRNWRKLRLLVLAEEPVCRACGRAVSEHVDHVDGDVHNLGRENLQGLCIPCHSAKTVRCDGGLGRRPKE
jgi:5-methylcytosine-specific restriction endonuclease McrA